MSYNLDSFIIYYLNAYVMRESADDATTLIKQRCHPAAQLSSKALQTRQFIMFIEKKG